MFPGTISCRILNSYQPLTKYLLCKRVKPTHLPYSVKYIYTHKYLQGKSKGSELFVSGKRGEKVFSVLSPYIDIAKDLENMPEVEQNIKLRRMDMNVKGILSAWKELQHVKSRKNELEEEKTLIKNTMRDLKKEKDTSKKEEMHKKCKIQGIEIREKLKIISRSVVEMEETIVLDFLKLPNKLLKMVGAADKILLSLYTKPSFDFLAKGHESLGKLNNELEFVNNSPTAYYLKNGLALLELSCGEYFFNIFKNHGYLPHSNPDFAKGVVVEGSGIHISEIDRLLMLADHNNNDVDKNSLYLVGGGSLQAFSAHFTKQVIDNPECLPQKLVAIGRNYSPLSSQGSGLLSCWQSTVVEGFAVFQNDTHLEEQMVNETLMALVQSYTQLKIHFEVIRYAAHNLDSHESAAIGVLMFSPVTKTYHEVGRLSVCGDYISKRLLMLHKASKRSSFLSMIHVRVCNMTHFLALMLENGQKESGSYDIPDILKKIMYV